MLFADFAEAVAVNSSQHEALRGLHYAERYLETSSYGKLRLEFVTLDRWLRLEHGFDPWLGSVGGSVNVRTVANAALAQADSELDSGEIDALMTASKKPRRR